MKTIHQDDFVNSDSVIPGLFQIAAQIENPTTFSAGKPTASVTEREFAALRSEAMKSMTQEKQKPRPKMPVTETCGWSFPFPIRK
jgi:hypothetical protein